jgi:hypothetical protein
VYQNEFAGSRLIAMRLLEAQALPFAFTCIEKGPKLFESLKVSILRHGIWR